MPNHVTNRIVCTGTAKDVASFQDLMVVPHEVPWENPQFDFNRIIPQPAILSKVISPARKGEHGRTLLYDEASTSYGEREATEEEQKELDALPYSDWYSWSVDNWGTKWNSYNFGEIDDTARFEFKFDTAWSNPAPVIDKLAERFPNLRFGVAWFDEGWCHAGEGQMGAGHPDVSMDDLACEPNAETYEKVYDEEPTVYIDDPIPEDVLDRLLNNFTCEDVAVISDNKGYFPLTGTLYSDDPELTDDELYNIRKSRDYIRNLLKA